MLTYTRYIMLVPKGGLEPPTFWLWFRRSKPTELRREKIQQASMLTLHNSVAAQSFTEAGIEPSSLSLT